MKLSLFLLPCLFIGVSCGQTHKKNATINVNEHIPQYESFEAIAPLFTQANDTVYVINFWATWCKPCVAELPFFEQLTKEYATQPVRVILVSLDFPEQIESKLIPFVRTYELQSEVIALLDERFNEWIPRVDSSWGGAIPVTHIHKGTQRSFHHRAFRTYSELQQLVDQMLTR